MIYAAFILQKVMCRKNTAIFFTRKYVILVVGSLFVSNNVYRKSLHVFLL